jgi:hypothetical protein
MRLARLSSARPLPERNFPRCAGGECRAVRTTMSTSTTDDDTTHLRPPQQHMICLTASEYRFPHGCGE